MSDIAHFHRMYCGECSIVRSFARTMSLQMENIGQFLDACYAFGLAKNDMFQTVDLYEAQNIPQVG